MNERTIESQLVESIADLLRQHKGCRKMALQHPAHDYNRHMAHIFAKEILARFPDMKSESRFNAIDNNNPVHKIRGRIGFDMAEDNVEMVEFGLWLGMDVVGDPFNTVRVTAGYSPFFNVLILNKMRYRRINEVGDMELRPEYQED